jgi:CTP synthase
MFVHLTLLPYIKTAGEMKTKPTQHSVKELRSIGIQPDVLICRAERSIDDVEKNKISLFTNVKPRNVISIPDVDTIYRLPEVLLAQQLHEIVTKQFQLTSKEPDLTPWNALVERQHAASGCLKIAIVGKYTDSKDAYKSLQEALIHAGIALSLTVDIVYVNADQVTIADLESMQLSAVLVPGGFGERGADGKIKVIRWARETAIPFLGICYGMQLAVVEFCRHVLGLATAHTTEVDADTDHPVVCLIEELQSVEPDEQKMGGNMRLGSVADTVLRGSLLHAIYESDRIEERHRHRYEVNPAYVEKLEASGLAVSARSEALGFVDVVELKKHPWFVGCQFHPEFLSKPLAPHPLFLSFLKAAKKHKLN